MSVAEMYDRLREEYDAAKIVYEALRARRLATKLEQVEGRTPEEAAAFQERARRLRSVG